LGLKENVIIGHLIPAGTGLEKYRKLDIVMEEEEVEPEPEKVEDEPAEEAETIEENA
jgi:DNA-directed RNA polymerase subunit beta'